MGIWELTKTMGMGLC